MQQLQEWIPMQYLVVAAVVLAVLFLVTLAFRMLAGRGSAPESSRLGVSEVLEVDKQRRLILVRRDDVEHLVLVGGNHDVVVESAIRPDLRRDDAPAAPRVVPGAPLEPEPEHAPMVARPRAPIRPVPLRSARPPVFGDQAPAPGPVATERAEPRLESLKGEDKSHKA
jgi:hypothetical protein